METSCYEHFSTTVNKKFTWDLLMIERLITCLGEYKTTCCSKGKAFDGDRPTQYKEIRKAMARIYRDQKTFFGAEETMTIHAGISDEERVAQLARRNAENTLIQRGHQRVQEKVKKIRQIFSKAVHHDNKSGIEKIVHEHHDALARIWSRPASLEPLPFGIATKVMVDSDTKIMSHGSADSSTDAEEELDQPTSFRVRKKRSIANVIPRLMDNKRRHFEKEIPAAQIDLQMDEAREDVQHRENISEAIIESSRNLSDAVIKVGDSIAEMGRNLSKSIELLSQAIINSQMPAACHPSSRLYSDHYQPRTMNAGAQEQLSDRQCNIEDCGCKLNVV